MDFPLLYRAHHMDYKTDIPFWLAIVDQYGGPILELGSGTGRVLFHIAAQGVEIYGLDNDPGMINELNNHIPSGLEPQITALVADMVNFHIDRVFPLVILPCNTYSTLNASQRKSTLQHVYDHLSDDGVFAFSMPNIDIFRRMPKFSEPELESSFTHPVTGNPVQISSGWKSTGESLEINWIYDHLLPDGQVNRMPVTAEHDLQPIQAYRQEIQDAGFLILGEFGDFNLSEYTEMSYYWITIARKLIR